MTRITEVQIFRWLGFGLVFLLLAFNRDFALVYLAMIFMDFVWWKTDKKVSLPTERVEKRSESLALAIGAYVVFFIANLAIRSVFGVDTGLQSVLTDLSSTTPILQNSTLLTFIGWGVLIPIIETRFFFGRVFEGMLEIFDTKVNNLAQLNFNGRVAFVAIVIGALFALFHITAKNLENVPLMLTFVFGFISCWLVVKEKQLSSAILFHIFTNATAILYLMRPETFSLLGLF